MRGELRLGNNLVTDTETVSLRTDNRELLTDRTSILQQETLELGVNG